MEVPLQQREIPELLLYVLAMEMDIQEAFLI